jgi:hypothetical protein
MGANLLREDQELRVGAQTDDELAKLAGDIASTIFHPVGTTRMGRDDNPMAVVNARLQVRGVAVLRVVDGCGMPSITRGNTNSPTHTIAEKAARWRLEDAAHCPIQPFGQRQSTHICQTSVSSGQGFPLNREIPEENEVLAALHCTHSMQSSTCVPRAEETLKPNNSNMEQHPTRCDFQSVAQVALFFWSSGHPPMTATTLPQSRPWNY